MCSLISRWDDEHDLAHACVYICMCVLGGGGHGWEHMYVCKISVRFEVLRIVFLKLTVIWDVT
jgi:hypothetical protein